jgi:CheY-like chemotaxis protein
VKQSELFDAIVAAVSPEVLTATSDAGPPAAAEVVLPRLNILLAEDSLVNQKLAVGLLERRGHRVTVANNGREALAAIEKQPFDLVLMDVQMPELDGLDATRALRERETVQGRAPVPIIAMTAHAMAGDRERCLAAGMNSYISKPIRSQGLFATIAHVVAGAAPPVASLPPDAAAMELDWSAALDTVGGDRQLLREIIEAFLQEAPSLLAELQQAASDGDLSSVRRAAHTLKASLRYLGATDLAEQAFALENFGREGRAAEAMSAVPRFNKALESLLTVLPRWVDNLESIIGK